LIEINWQGKVRASRTILRMSF